MEGVGGGCQTTSQSASNCQPASLPVSQPAIKQACQQVSQSVSKAASQPPPLHLSHLSHTSQTCRTSSQLFPPFSRISHSSRTPLTHLSHLTHWIDGWMVKCLLVTTRQGRWEVAQVSVWIQLCHNYGRTMVITNRAQTVLCSNSLCSCLLHYFALIACSVAITIAKATIPP